MSEPPTVPAQPHTAVWLEGLTQHAAQSLPTNPFRITIFPFRLGRRSHDPLVHNDLTLADSAPWQISRHHLTLVKHEDRIGAVDRGSRLGAFVDEKQLGGPGGDPGPLFFSSPEGSLVLGTKRSPFRYKVVIGTAADMPRLD